MSELLKAASCPADTPTMVIRRALVATLLGLVPLAACADGGTAEPQPQGGPAASIDREADGVLTGPVNQARDTADDAEARQQELEQAGD